MSRPVIQLKERLLTACPNADKNPESVSLSAAHHAPEFSLDCLLSTIKIEDKVGLLSRVSYYFPKELKVSSKDAFSYAESINPLLTHSQVFVVRDLDGDHGYSLRMDTVHDGSFQQESLTAFFDRIRQDVTILLKYFGAQLSIVNGEAPAIGLGVPAYLSA